MKASVNFQSIFQMSSLLRCFSGNIDILSLVWDGRLWALRSL
jgi:hypothetical protein